jgi:hypothetical protein
MVNYELSAAQFDQKMSLVKMSVLRSEGLPLFENDVIVID